MKLIDLLKNLGSLDRSDTIYVSEPWTKDSMAIATRETESGIIPHEAQILGLRYFLEVAIAIEILSDWVSQANQDPTCEEKCQRLIQYAMTDA